MSPPGSPVVSEVATAELRRALEDALGGRGGCQVESLTRRPSAYRSCFALEEVDARLSDGTELALVLKDLSEGRASLDARRVKPAFLYDPAREVAAYRTFLAAGSMGTARCYAAVSEPETQRHWLLLERVTGRELYQVGEFDLWEHAASRLAAMHARWAGEVPRWEHPARLLRLDAQYYRLWPGRALAVARTADASRRDPQQHRLAWLADRYEPVVEHLAALPTTIIHGEFYASNVLVQQASDGPRLCPIDWERASVGPGLIDLAALTAGQWSAQERTALAAAYRAAAGRDGAAAVPLDDLLVSLDYCRLHLAVQWLGWSSGWSPPSQHAHDWLDEAIGLAEALGL